MSNALKNYSFSSKDLAHLESDAVLGRALEVREKDKLGLRFGTDFGWQTATLCWLGFVPSWYSVGAGTNQVANKDKPGCDAGGYYWHKPIGVDGCSCRDR
jgi:hypothetical protein